MTALSSPQDHSLSKIAPAVIAAHLLFLFFLIYYSPSAPPLKMQHKKLMVSTIKLTPKPAPVTSPPPQAVQQSAQQARQEEPAKEPPPPQPVVASPPKPPPPAVKPKPQPAVQPKKAQPAKKAAPKKAAAPKPKAPPEKPKPVSTKKETAPKINEQQIALLSKAKEKIGKINTSSDKMSATTALSIAVPSQIDSLSIDTLKIDSPPTMGSQEIAYRDELAQRLKLQLKLPEYGSIKLKLTIAKNGKVKKVLILNSESQLNKQHVEKTLPLLSMPPFGSQFNGAEEYTFTINMSNDV